MEHNHLEKEKIVDMRKIGAIIQKNMTVILRDKARILPLIMFPVFMIMIFGFTSGNTPKHIPTAIISYDNSPLSERIQQEIGSSQTFTIRNLLSTEGEGKKLLDTGKVRVLIEIPQNLQDKIDNGKSVGIIVIVDEADSAVASTAKQTISSIINSLSNEISTNKVANFQTQVDDSYGQIFNYNSLFQNKYGAIASKAKSAESSLDDANKKISAQADVIENSLESPAPVVAPEVKPNDESANFNQTYLPETPAYLSAKGQVALLRQTSAMIQYANVNVHEAATLASGENEKLKSNNEYESQKSNLELPQSKIKQFTKYPVRGLLRPLIYDEKPAYGTGKRTIDFIIPSIIALTIFQGAVMGMGRAVAGEKKEGSLTRVFLTPTSNVTIILGTLLFYIIFEVFRSSFLILLAMNLFHVKIEGSLIAVFIVVVIYAGVSTAIGMLLSSAVKSEQQYLGVSMLVSMPTIFLGGAFFPLQAMPKFLQAIASVLPVTYAGNALRGVMIKGFSIFTISYELSILLLFLAFTVGAVFLVFKRDIE